MINSWFIAVKVRDVKDRGRECFLVELLHVDNLSEDLTDRLAVTYPQPADDK